MPISTQALTSLNLESAIVRDPLVVSPTTTVMDAIAQMGGMRSHCDTIKTVNGQLEELHRSIRSSCVVVVEAEKVVGILTERDIVRMAAQQQPLDRLLLKQVMVPSVITLSETSITDLFSVINLLKQYKIRHLPILDEQKHLAGLVTHESLRHSICPFDLLRLRIVQEVMTRDVISAEADSSLLAIAQQMTEHRVSSVVIVRSEHQSGQIHPIPVGILTERDLVQFQALGLNLENCQAEAMMSTPIFTIQPEESLWVVQQIMEQHFIQRLVVTGEQGELLGIITQTSLLQAFNPLELYKLAESLKDNINRLEAERVQLLENRALELERQVEVRTIALQIKAERERLVAQIANRIRTSLNLQEILATCVTEVRGFLGCDRVLIYQFESDLSGVVIAESVEPGWLTALGNQITDSCFQQQQASTFYTSDIPIVVNDLSQSNYSDCHLRLLETYQVKANLVVPIRVEGQLWGLLIGHHCADAREWPTEAVGLLQDIAVQLAIALQQAITYQQLQDELQARQQAEARLRESEAKSRAILSAIPDLILRVGADGVYRECATPRRELDAIPPEVDPTGRFITEILPAELAEQHLDYIGRALQTGELQVYEQQIQIDDRWQDEEVRVIKSGEDEVLLIIRDITDRKQAEAERLQAKQVRLELKLLEQILDIVLAGYWDWDIPSNQEYLSPGFKRMFGYEDQELANHPESWQNLVFPEDLSKVFANFQEHVQSGGQVPFCSEIRYRHKNGSTVWVICSGQVIEWDATGQPLRMIGCHINITDRRVAEEALRQSEARFQKIAESSPAEIYVLVQRPDGSIYFESMSAVVQEIQEVTPEQVLENAAILFKQIHPEDVAGYQQAYQHSLSSLQLFQHEWRIITPSGKQKWLQATARPEQRQPDEIAWYGVALDITAHKQAEMALQNKTDELDRFFSVSLDLLCIADASGHFRRLNRQWEKTLGYSLSALEGSQFLDYVHPDDLEETLEQVTHLESGLEILNFVNRYRCQDGSYRWIEWRSFPSEQLIYSAARDITEQKQAEVAMKQQLATIEAAIDGIAILQGETYLFLNRSHLSMFGYEPAELLGQSWRKLYSQTELQRFEQEVFPVLGRDRSWQGEAIATRKDGSTFEEGLSLTLTDEGLLICVCRDISEQQAALRERKRAEAELQRTNEELARATRLKDEFLANMSHELRTPLNAILGMTEGLQEEVFGQVTIEQIKALQTIERSGYHLLELINDILDVAKIESGQIELNCAPTAIAPLCQSSLAFIKQQALKKRIQLETKLPSQLPNLLVDERRIRQVLINLLNNAVKFTPEGGRITLEVGSIQLAQQEGGQNSLQISVIDTGIGIAPEHRHKLFQPFVQIDSALNRQYQGTGLGLALVKRIVELHGGQVGLTSEVGIGSCFTIDLPCAEALPTCLFPEAQTHAGLESSQASQALYPLILLAEDNEANINTVSSYLKAKGYRILLAKNGQEAIKIAQSARPDLILMDIQMPGMDGLEAIQHIRQDPTLSQVPIVALTALAMPGDHERCLSAGANDYLSKPIKLKQLASTIQGLLSGK